MSKFNILEDTCRDSLYVSNFLIESEVILEFAGKISDIGIEHIEVGHPLGLGAHRKYSSGFTDEQLFSVLQTIIKKTRYFVFFLEQVQWMTCNFSKTMDCMVLELG